MFSPQTPTRTRSPKNIIFAASLLLAFMIGLPDKQANAQFRFKSSYGHQSSRSRSTASRYPNSNRLSDQNQNAVRRSSTTTGNTQRNRKTSSQAQRIKSSLEPRKSGTTVSRFQPSRIKSQPKPTRESWSRADQILGNLNKSKVRGETPRRPNRSESGFDTKDFELAKNTNRGIFPGERRPGSRAADSNAMDSKSSAKASVNRTPRLSSIIAERIAGRGTRTRESEQEESSRRERPDQADSNHIDVDQDRSEKTETADSPRSPIGGGNIFDGIGGTPGREDYQNQPEDSGGDSNTPAPASTPTPTEEPQPQDNQDGEDLDPGHNDQTDNAGGVECKEKIREIILDVLDRVGPDSAPIVVAPSVEPSIIVQPVVVQPQTTGSESAPEGLNAQNSITQAKRKIRTDLEVVGVKFVDFGNKKENTGPKFKIEIRNHNNKFAAESVSIAVIAAIDFKDDLLGRTAVEANIETIPPRGTTSIDVQLSREAYELISGEGQTAIFAELAVIADPEQQFIDVRPENNVWVQSIDDIEMEE